MKLLAGYSINVTGGSKKRLMKGGWKIIERRKTVPVEIPVDITADYLRGKSGEVKLRWKAQKGATFLIEFSNQNKMVPTVWRFAGISSQSKFIVQDLTPGVVYSFRLFAARGKVRSGASNALRVMA